MSILHAIILGIVQGLCEFLPVSSSGHLVLLQNIFGIEEGALFFDAMLHLGTLISVCVYFRHTLFKMIRRPFSKYPMFVVLATIPTIIMTLLFSDFIDEAFGGKFLGICFLITAIFLFVSSRIPKGRKTLKEMRWYDALFVGTMQGLAIPPGISRSGSTITGGLLRGFDQGFVAEFSFMMSIPAILGSAVLEFVKLPKMGLGDVTIPGVIVGTLFAMISGFFAIRVMMSVIKKGKLGYFAIYCAVLGVFVMIDQYITHFFF